MVSGWLVWAVALDAMIKVFMLNSSLFISAFMLKLRKDSVEILEWADSLLSLKYKVIKYPQNNTGQNGF